VKEIIEYNINDLVTVEEIIEVFISSGINRPVEDKSRIKMMFQNSNLIVSARVNEKLIGIARALTDFSYCCYLSDIAIIREHQNTGVGTRLIEIIKQEIGEKVMLLLLSAPNAMEFYPKIGFEQVRNGFIIKRLN
jgi:N-acetylglutamate synthase-like GNAT family acetyltransferase